MPVLAFSEYRPDVSDYEGNSSKDITNVVPRGDGYGPFPVLSAFTVGLPAACRGCFFARKSDNTVSIFAGTSNKLYNLSNATGAWTDVSRSGGTYTALLPGANWTFAQFNNYVFATQQNDNLQIFDLTASAAFADRADSNCPQAAYVTVVNSFIVLTGIAAPNVYRIQWSGLNDVSSSSAFTSGVNSSDFQDLADGGLVRGASGGEYGVIFQDTTIRRLLYSPGSAFVFQIDRIAVDDGLLAPYSLVRSGNNIFWISPQGFKMLPPGGVPTPIGKERIDRTFFNDYDSSNLQLVIGANDPSKTRVLFAYKSLGNVAMTCDKMLCYDWALDRWTLISGGGFNGIEFLASLAHPQVTLEGVDAAFGTGTPVAATGYSTLGIITSQQTLVPGQGVIVTSSSGSTGLPAWYTAGVPYYVTTSNLTTSSFSLTTSGGIGTAITTGGTTTVRTAASSTSTTTGTGTLSYAVESIETLNLGSLDNISNASIVDLAGVDTSGKFGFFTPGNFLQATMETPEQGGDGRRMFVRGFRVVSDATTGSILGSVSYREGPQLPYNYSVENTPDVRGYIPLRISTRYARAKIRIPQTTSWTYAAGIEADNSPEGKR